MFIKELGLDVKGLEQAIIKEVDSKQGIVSGYYSAFDVVDADNQIVPKGAFKKSIEERGPKSSKPRIKHLLDHNKHNAVATIQELTEDNYGLLYVSKAGRHTNGQDWLKMCEDGIITEHSTGAIYPQSKITKKNGVEILNEAILLEGSSLQFLGANGHTPIVNIKERKLPELQSKMKHLEKCIRNGKYSDEAFKELENTLSQIKSLVDILLGETTQPDSTVQQPNTTEPNTEEETKPNIVKQLFTFQTSKN